MTAPKLLPDPEVSFAVPAFPTITKNISSGRLTHLHHVEVEDGVGKSFPANFAQFSEGQTRFVRAIRPIVLVSGEPPYLLNRVSYLTDPAYAGRFDANPLLLPHAAE